MTAQEIAGRFLTDPQPMVAPESLVTKMRVLKLKALCQRSKVEYSDVCALLPVEIQQQITDHA